MEKAILKKSGIILDVIGECGRRVLNNGNIEQEYRVKKEMAALQYTFRVCKSEMEFINV